VATRSYLSIGEVLVTLKTEFPDVTISKIRFLEGEGLIDPERTPSGYRKFYDTDVTRLRQILRLQRDEYLPLKVIKDRLAKLDEEPLTTEEIAADATAEDEVTEPPSGFHMSIEELSSATGVDRERIRELESFGIIGSQNMNGGTYYDGEAFVILSIVREFFRFGVEPRHLSMYRHFAEREATFFEGIVMPMLRQRNPDARRTATDNLTQLAATSRKLKQALLRSNLRQYLETP
jgi:DNA-binding transcriptional MerR regulator